MRINIQLFVTGFFMSVAAFSQQYQDKSYLQDYADKFELKADENESDLIRVRTDRNNSVIILSKEVLLQPWDKILVSDQRYHPLTD